MIQSPLYIADPNNQVNFEKYGPARLRFLIESLSDLDAQFRERYQSRLIILLGNPREIFDEFAKNLAYPSPLFCVIILRPRICIFSSFLIPLRKS